jgi:outer membrane autotransporter protein
MVIGNAAGSTSIVIRDLNPSAVGAINLTGVTVVDATGGTGSEFHMVPAVVDKGFVQYELRYFSAVFNWNIVALPSAEGFEMLKVAEAGQDFWRHPAEAWSARMQETRDAAWGGEQRSEGWEMWAQAHAGGQQTDRHETFLVGPFTFNQNLSVDSDWRGFQMGGDNKASGNWSWGFTGGFMQQESRVHQDRNSFDLEGWNVGLYTGFNSGSFFANGLIKGDWFNVDANMHTVPAMAHFDGHSWGVKGEAGWRMGSSRFYLEPFADIDWISTHIDDANFASAGAKFTFGDATSAKGSIGARMGGSWGSIVPYAGVYWVDEFRRDNSMTMITGAGCPAACMTIEDKAPQSYGKVDFGFTTKSWNGLEGFLKGEELFSGDYQGFTGRLGVRWKW